MYYKRTLMAVFFAACLFQVCSAQIFIDAVNGSDDNSGLDPRFPWQTQLNIGDIYSCRRGQVNCQYDMPPENAIYLAELGENPTVTFFPGEYSSVVQVEPTRGRTGDAYGFFNVSDVNGLNLIGKAGAVFSAQDPNGREMETVSIIRSSNTEISGITFRENFGRAIWLAQPDGTNSINGNVFDSNFGVAENNMAAVEILGSIAGSSVSISRNLFRDNYDRTQKNRNSRAIVYFVNDGHQDASYNTIYQTVSSVDRFLGGAAIDVKHPGTGPIDIHHNEISNASFSGIGISGRNSNVFNNYFKNSAGVSIRDEGGTLDFREMKIHNNTIVNRERNDPSRTANFPLLVRNTENSRHFEEVGFFNNIVSETRPQYFEFGAVVVDTYSPNDALAATEGELEFDGNWYNHESEEPLFNFFSWNEPEFRDQGFSGDFQRWQAAGFDPNGSVDNLEMYKDLIPTNPDAQKAGWLAGPTPRLSVHITDKEIGGANGVTITANLLRTGNIELGEEEVSLILSDDSYLNVPENLNFADGQIALEFQITLAYPPLESVFATSIIADSPNYEIGQAINSWVAVSPCLLGDANCDGKVGMTDFLLLVEDFGEQGEWFNGDFDRNGKMDLYDFGLLKANAGRRFDVNSVPEPTSAQHLLALSLLLLIRPGRRN